MKKYLLPSLKMTLLLILICAGLYPLFIATIARLAPGGGDGEKLYRRGVPVGYALVGQKFTHDEYFWGRPSAVDYNAAGSGGSNKGPTNPDYLKLVQDRLDSFLVHNPGIRKSEVPAELVTASGSGLDPDISPQGALVQVRRIAAVRHLPEAGIRDLITSHTEKPLLGLLGPPKVNVLRLNLALDEIK
jgi:potassium-transporting ATPase KdpC subunit